MISLFVTESGVTPPRFNWRGSVILARSSPMYLLTVLNRSLYSALANSILLLLSRS